MRAITRKLLCFIWTTLLLSFVFLAIAASPAHSLEPSVQDYKWYTSNTSSDTYIIASVGELSAFSDLVNGAADTNGDGNADFSAQSFEGKTVVLSSDLSLSESGEFVPIGTSTHPFNGRFNGNGHTVSNISITQTVANCGLFGVAGSKSVIENINVSGSIVVNTSTEKVKNLGSVVGQSDGSINNCFSNMLINITSATPSTENMVATIENVGGVAGKVAETISSCTFEGSLQITDHIGVFVDSTSNDVAAGIAVNIGGIVGYAGIANVDLGHQRGTIVDCSNAGSLYLVIDGDGGRDRFGEKVQSASMYVGGIVGYSYNSIFNSYNRAEIRTSKHGEKKFGYSATDGNGGSAVGGIVGALRSRASVLGSGTQADSGSADDVLTIKNCANTGSVIGKNAVGGIVGISGSYTVITQCYNGNGDDKSGLVISTRWNKPGNGGIAGQCYGTISYCYNRGEINNTQMGYYVAGICGMLLLPPGNKKQPEIYGCYNAGRIAPGHTANWRYGGIVGQNDGNVHDCVVMKGTVLSHADAPIGGDIRNQWSNLRVLTYEELQSPLGLKVINNYCRQDSDWQVFWHLRGESFNDGYPVLNVHEPQAANVNIAASSITILSIKNAPFSQTVEPVPEVSLAIGSTTLVQNADFYVIPQQGAFEMSGDDKPYIATIVGIGNYYGRNATLVHYGIGVGTLENIAVVASSPKFNYEVQFPEKVTVYDEAGGLIAPSQYSYIIYDNNTYNLTSSLSSKHAVYDSKGYIAFKDENVADWDLPQFNTPEFTSKTTHHASSAAGLNTNNRVFRVFDRAGRLISDSDGYVYEPLTGACISGVVLNVSDAFAPEGGLSCFEYLPERTTDAHDDTMKPAGYVMEIRGEHSGNYSGSSGIGYYIIKTADLFTDCIIEKIHLGTEWWFYDMSKQMPYRIVDNKKVYGMRVPFIGDTIKPVVDVSYLGRKVSYPIDMLINNPEGFADYMSGIRYTYGKLKAGTLTTDDLQPNRNVTAQTDYMAALTIHPRNLSCLLAQVFKADGSRSSATGIYDAAFSNYVVIPFDIEPIDIAACTINAPDQAWSGSAKTPVEVFCEDKKLIEGQDYRIEYSSNIEKGNADFTITPLAPNLFGNPISGSFSIEDAREFEILPIPNQTFSGLWLTPELSVVDKLEGTKVLKEGRDYDYAFYDKATGNPVGQNSVTKSHYRPGTYEIRVVGNGLYAGYEAKRDFTIDLLNLSTTNPDDWDITDLQLVHRVGSSDSSKLTYKGNNIGGVLGDDYTLIDSFGNERRNHSYYYEAGFVVTKIRFTAGTYLPTFVNGSFIEFELSKPTTVQPCPITTRGLVTVNLQKTYTGLPIVVDELFTASSNLVENVDYTTTYQDNINVGTGTLIVQGIGNFTGSRAEKITILPRPLDTAMATAIPDQTFTGSPAAPDLTLTYNGMTLEKGKDFTVAYGNNGAPGIGYAYVSAMGNYSGSLVVPFNIVADLSGVNIAPVADQIADMRIDSATGLAGEVYGARPKPVVSITRTGGDYVLIEGVDYTLSYQDNLDITEVGSPAKVIITGTGGFSGSRVATFNIVAKATFDNSHVTYGQGVLSSQFAVYDKDGTLIEPSRYTALPTNPLLPVGASGEALLKITDSTGVLVGVEGYVNYVVDTKAQASLVASTAGVPVSVDVSKVYTGNSITLTDVVLKDSTLGVDLLAGVDEDYTLSYTDDSGATRALNAGVAYLKVALNSPNYVSQTALFPFTIAPYDISASGALTITAIASQVYTGTALEPALSMRNKAGFSLTKDKDYTATYSSNNSAGVGMAKITGIGNYTGERGVTFDIVDSRIDLESNYVVLDASKTTDTLWSSNTSYTYTGLPIKPAIKVLYNINSGGAKAYLVQGQDYEVTYSDNVALGVAVINIKGIGAYKGALLRSFKIVEEAAPPNYEKDNNDSSDNKKLAVTLIFTPLKTLYIQKGKSLVVPVVAYGDSGEIRTDLVWQSSNSKVAKVSVNGKIVIAKSVKKKTKVVISAVAPNGKTLKLTVYAVPKASKLTKLTVSKWPSGGKLKVGKSAQLALKIKPASATNLKVVFKSSKASGLYVNKAGKLTAKKKGTYKITVKVGTKSVSKKIKVV